MRSVYAFALVEPTINFVVSKLVLQWQWYNVRLNDI